MFIELRGTVDYPANTSENSQKPNIIHHMPTQTTIYPASTSGGNSSDISVDQGQIAVVILAPSGTSELPPIMCPIMRKVGTAYVPVADGQAQRARLNNSKTEVVISAPGVYRVVVPATSTPVTIVTDR